MMNVTINQTNDASGKCDTTNSFDITSDLITDYVAGLPSPDHTLDLKVIYNGGDEITINITDANPNLDNGTNTYTLTPDDLSQVDEISNGVYSLELLKTVTATNGTTSEYYCVFSDCGVACTVDDCVLNDPTTLSPVYYTVLTNLNICDACNCDDAFMIWDDLQDILNECESKNSGCGCK